MQGSAEAKERRHRCNERPYPENWEHTRRRDWLFPDRRGQGAESAQTGAAPASAIVKCQIPGRRNAFPRQYECDGMTTADSCGHSYERLCRVEIMRGLLLQNQVE